MVKVCEVMLPFFGGALLAYVRPAFCDVYDPVNIAGLA